LSIVIALVLLRQPQFAISPIVYLFTMYITVFSFIAYCRFVRDRKTDLDTKEFAPKANTAALKSAIQEGQNGRS